MAKQYSRTKNSSLNFLTGIGSQLIVTILKFVVRTVFIQVLGKEYLGIGGLFHNILQFLSLTELGMDTAINFKMYKPLANNDEHRVRVLLKFYKQAYIIIGTVIFVLGLMVIPALPVLIKNYDSLGSLGINAPLLFCMYLLQSVSSYWFFAYRSTIIKTAQKTYILNAVDMVINITTCIVQILVLKVIPDKSIAFLTYVAVIIVFNIIKNGVNALISQHMFKYAFVAEADSITKEERNEILKDCGALFVYKVNKVVVKASDNIVLSSFIGLAVVGIYANYLLIYTTARSFLSSIYTSVKASIGNVYATETVEKNYLIFEVMNFLTFLTFGTVAVGIALCSNTLIDVWIGPEYLIPQPFPLLIGTEILLFGIKYNLGQVRSISGAFRQNWARPIASIIVNLVVSISLCILMGEYGIFGVVIGTIVSDLTTFLAVDPKIIHKYSFNNYRPTSYYYKKNLLFLFVLALVTAIDYFIIKVLVPEPSLWSLLLSAAICGISVPAVFIALYWKTDFCQFLISKLSQNKKLKKFLSRI